MFFRILKVEIKCRILSVPQSSMEIYCHPYYNFFMKKLYMETAFSLNKKSKHSFPEIYVVQYLHANKMLNFVYLISHSIKWLLMILLFLEQCEKRLHFFKMVDYIK